MGKKEPLLEKFRRQDSKLYSEVLESNEFQDEMKHCLTMQDLPAKDIEIDRQR